jgi:hypothetical protein
MQRVSVSAVKGRLEFKGRLIRGLKDGTRVHLLGEIAFDLDV